MFKFKLFSQKKKAQGSTIVFHNKSNSNYTKRFLVKKIYILFKKIILFLLLIIVALSLILIILDSVLYIKNRKGLGLINFVVTKINVKNKKEHVELVKGLEKYKIYSFPNSRFVFNFDENISSDAKKQIELFLAYGNSVYLLPNNTDFNSIKQEYKTQLVKQGWNFVGEKKLTDENGLAGLYFTKKNIGLRIYTITNYDMWYEILTKKQALSFLKQRILNIKAKQQSITTDSNKLSPKYNLHLILVDGITLDAIKLPAMNAYFLTFYDRQKKPILRIIPYKKNYLQVTSSQLKTLGLQYLQDSNRVLNLSSSYSFKKVEYFDIFNSKKYVPVNFLYQDINIDELKNEYKLTNWYELEYFTINTSKINKLYIKQHKNIIWIIDVL